MFNSCSSLTELNLENFNTNNCNSFIAIFTGVKNVKVNINKENNIALCEKNIDKLEISN